MTYERHDHSAGQLCTESCPAHPEHISHLPHPQEKADRLINSEGILSEADVTGYYDEIFEAFRIHVEKEAIRNGLWKDYPAEDQCNQIKIKIDRILRSLERLPSPAVQHSGLVRPELRDELIANMLEELRDIINYSVFAARILKGTL